MSKNFCTYTHTLQHILQHTVTSPAYIDVHAVNIPPINTCQDEKSLYDSTRLQINIKLIWTHQSYWARAAASCQSRRPWRLVPSGSTDSLEGPGHQAPLTLHQTSRQLYESLGSRPAVIGQLHLCLDVQQCPPTLQPPPGALAKSNDKYSSLNVHVN